MGTVRALSGNGSLARVPVCVRTAWVGSHFGSSMHSTQVASQPQPFRRAHSEHTSTLVGMSQHSMRAHTGSTLISILLACGTSVEHVCLFTLTGLSSSGQTLLVLFLFFSGGWNTVDGTNPAWVSAHSRFTPPPPNFNIDMYLPIAPGRSIAGNPASKVFTTYFSNIKVWGKGGQTKTIR